MIAPLTEFCLEIKILKLWGLKFKILPFTPNFILVMKSRKTVKGRIFSTHGQDERCRTTWEGNIRIDLKEILYGDVDWTQLAQDSDQWHGLVSALMIFRIS
jgi:hypothetical protein